MTENSKQFPHVRLRFVRQGNAKPATGGSSGKINPVTAGNKTNRWGHGSRLKSSVSSIAADWQSSIKEREEKEKPELPEARRIILQVDPKAFDPDKLKGYGIEVIGDLEDGYIIGASADLELTELQKKIEKFLKEERGGGTVSEIWELIDGQRKPELILSSELWKHWDKVQDNQVYTVDVGISCIGTKTKLPDCPTQREDEKIDKYYKRLSKWIEKRDLIYQDWDDIAYERQEKFTKFIDNYSGTIVSSFIESEIPLAAKLPDSFSCRIQISGKGLKDLVFNFPYIFEVSEPDKFAELIQDRIKSESTESSFELLPPEKDAPKVCVIDSGIQERHPQLRAAIDSQASTCWIPNESDRTADYVGNGGHGTRVAGAIIYPRNIPRTGQQQAICWLQNARVLDSNCQLQKKLFPSNVVKEIVNLYHKQHNTRIFNHSITGSTPCRTRYMSAWAAEIDNLTYENDILFVVAAGNLPLSNSIGNLRLSIQSDINLLHAIRTIGYGIPNLDRAMGNFPNRITLITRGEETIKARQARIYQVQLPSELRALGDEIEILLEITLSYKAQPRRTRRDRRRYLSTWLDWDCSKKGENPDAFLERMLKEYDAPEDVEKGEKGFKWTLGKRKTRYGKIDGVSRSAGTIQKDWTIVKSYELRDAFCIAVVGHEGWNNDPDAYAPYSLVVSFEAINADIPVYSRIVEAQIPLEVETQLRV